MGEQLFLFVQMEFPWELGPADGRYLLRASLDGQAEHVVVLNTLGAERHTRRRAAKSQRVEGDCEPARVLVARATIIDPVPVGSERQAQAWLKDVEAERHSDAAAATLNRVLFYHRIATADPHVHEVSPAQAIAIRAGWGDGEQVAYGRFHDARELPLSQPRWRRRSSALRPQERLAVLLGGRGAALICEELTLRARLDYDQGRLMLAALELERAYVKALSELREEQRTDLEERIAELEQLRGAVEQLAMAEEPDPESLRQPLERLEAALRARTAVGFQQQ
ncbi:MAG TPA: hypothetical protein VGF15_05915 [Solirubrobacteraceae bacterium]